MFPKWRLQLREARLAIADGRWEEAAQTLAADPLRQFLPAKRLSEQLARELVGRAGRRLEEGKSAAGWRDLDQAAGLGVSESEIGQFRRLQIERRLSEVEKLVVAGEITAASRELTRMKGRGLRDRGHAAWEASVELIERSQRQTRRGEFSQAVETLRRAVARLPDDATGAADQLRLESARLEQLSAEAHAAGEQLYAALAEANWGVVLSAASRLLELAPGHVEAQRARRRAWRELGIAETAMHRRQRAVMAAKRPSDEPARRPAESTDHPGARVETDTMTASHSGGRRLVAWIDRVGGYLICLGDEVVLGRPDPAGGADIPLGADLSRRHAMIRREGEAYVVTPVGPTYLEGVRLTGPAVLQSDATIQLGDAVKLRFRRPHALSATAVLEVTSSHKTKPAVDGIVLMSESCILGPRSHCHVPCRHWSDDLVLFRQGEELLVRGGQPLEVNGQSGVEQAAVVDQCRVVGDDFALGFEEI